MSKATEVFHQLDLELREQQGDEYPLAGALELQIRLAEKVQGLIADVCVEAPSQVLGRYEYSDREPPYSTTGQVLYVEKKSGLRLALKFVGKPSPGNGERQNDPTYAFERPEVRIMTTIGEVLMGMAANKNAAIQMYYGVAGVESISRSRISLKPFSIEKILSGEMEPVIVMRQMDTTMADVLLDVRESLASSEQPRYSRQQVHEWAEQAIDQVFNSAVALPEDLASEFGAPEEVEELLVGKTIGWLTSRLNEERVQEHPLLVKAIEHAIQVQDVFLGFFAREETYPNLDERAVPTVQTKPKNDTLPVSLLAQTFSSGDTKFGNMMLGHNGSNELQVGLFDPQWLVLREGAVDNDLPEFAPWPFADLMQIAAYAAAQPAAYGYPELQQMVYDRLREYYGPTVWTEWHELYMKMLTSYKLLVDVAFAIDPYIEKMAAGEEIPRSLKWILEKHPRMALEVANRGSRVYDDYLNDQRQKAQNGKKASN